MIKVERLVILISLFATTIFYSQKKTMDVQTESKTILYNNGREVFNICKLNQNVAFNERLNYFWYNDFSKIKNTKGSSGGQLLHGKYQFFDEKGNLIIESNYYLGLKDGLEREWDGNGEIKSTNKFKKGNQIYSKFKGEDSENWIEWVGPFLQVGSVKNIYTNYGQMVQSELYLENLKSKVTVFYDNKKIKEVYTTNPGDWMYDEYIKYYESGKIKVYGKFEDNWKIGEWKWFNEDGTVESVEKNRIQKIYSSDGVLIEQGGEYFDVNTKSWQKNGFWYWYKDDGKNIKDLKEYKYGEEIVREIKK